MDVETTEHPLTFTTRFDVTGPQVIVAGYADPAGRERLIGATFGPMQLLWSETDEVRFPADSRELIGATLHLPPKFALPQICHKPPEQAADAAGRLACGRRGGVGGMVGWSLSDPARYLTDSYADPETGPPATATRLRLAECLALISEPLVDGVMDGEPDTWHRLRSVELALLEQREDRRRADVLHRVVSQLIEDYGS
ncbi:hypothetical protein SALBM311S_03421 [Streptomyces alboniger]